MRLVMMYVLTIVSLYGNGVLLSVGGALVKGVVKSTVKSSAKHLLSKRLLRIKTLIDSGVISDKDMEKALGLIRGRIKADDSEIEDCIVDMYTNPKYKGFNGWTNEFDRNIHTCIHAYPIPKRLPYLKRVRDTIRIVKSKKSFKNWFKESRGRVLIWRDGFMVVITLTKKVVSAYHKRNHNEFHRGGTLEANKIRRKLWRK